MNVCVCSRNSSQTFTGNTDVSTVCTPVQRSKTLIYRAMTQISRTIITTLEMWQWHLQTRQVTLENMTVTLGKIANWHLKSWYWHSDMCQRHIWQWHQYIPCIKKQWHQHIRKLNQQVGEWHQHVEQRDKYIGHWHLQAVQERRLCCVELWHLVIWCW